MPPVSMVSPVILIFRTSPVIAHTLVPRRKSGELVYLRHELAVLSATSSHVQRIQCLNPDRHPTEETDPV